MHQHLPTTDERLCFKIVNEDGSINNPGQIKLPASRVTKIIFHVSHNKRQQSWKKLTPHSIIGLFSAEALKKLLERNNNGNSVPVLNLKVPSKLSVNFSTYHKQLCNKSTYALNTTSNIPVTHQSMLGSVQR